MAEIKSKSPPEFKGPSEIKAPSPAAPETINSPAEPVIVPPIVPFLTDPIPFGAPQQYLLLQFLGKGLFGEAYVAVLRRDLGLKAGVALPSCRQLFDMAPRHFVIKRFRLDNAQEPQLSYLEMAGKNDAQLKQLMARKQKEMVEERKQMFEQEQRNAAWIKNTFQHPNILSYQHDLKDTETGTLAMVFEFCNCGDIRRMISGCKDGTGKLIHLTLFEALHISIQITKRSTNRRSFIAIWLCGICFCTATGKESLR